MEPLITDTLTAKARAGDRDAFRLLTDPHRQALQIHCYRMLGSYHDAEEALQETLLAAWRGLARFEERASLRTWLYRIATNRCLNMRRAIRRRPAKAWDIPGIDLLEPTRLDAAIWLEPLPDAVAAGAIIAPESPDARLERTQAVSLAFIKALQLLPPRQIAVLILRDVVGFSAEEVAGMLDASLDAVNSALKRARAGLAARRPDEAQPPGAGSHAENAITDRFVKAWESADLDALVSVLTDNVFMAMPPMPYLYIGRDIVRRFCANMFAAGRRPELARTRANGQPAFGVYVRTPDGRRRGTGLYVLTLTGDRICGMTRFESHVLPWFGLPLISADGPPAQP